MKFIHRIKKSEFLKNTTILMSGTIIAQILPIIFAPLISRLFTPEDFSVYGVFFSLYSIMGVALTLGYDKAAMLPNNSKKAIKVINLCLINSIALTFLFFVLIVFFGEYLATLFNLKTLGKWILLLPLSAFFLSVNNVLITYYNRNKRYNTISKNRISRSVLKTSSNIILGFMKVGHSGLIIGQFISDVLAACFYLIDYYCIDLKKKIQFNCKSFITVAQEYKDFPAFFLPTILIDTISKQLPILLITTFFSSALSGSYFFAMQILALPAALIGSAYAQTFFQRFTSLIQVADYHGARNLLFRSWLLLFSLIIIPAIILIFWAEPLFSFVFGGEWAQSGAISSILIFYIMFAFISSPTSTTYVSLRMQKYSLLFGMLVLTYRFLSFYIGYLKNDFYLALKILVICEIIEIIVYNSVVIFKIQFMSIKG